MQTSANKCKQVQTNANKCKQMQTNANKCKQMQKNANKQTVGRDNSTPRRRGHVERHDKNRHGRYCTRRERGRGNGVREGKKTQEVNKKIVQLSKANNCDDIYPNKPVNIVFLLVFERTQAAPVYATNNRQFLSWKNMHYEVQAKQINTGKFANIGVSYIQAIFYALTG